MKVINTEIKSVTVFPNEAKIIRFGGITLSKGREKITLPGLPQRLEPNSLRVKTIGTSSVKFFSIDIKKTFFKDIPDGIIRDISKKIRNLHEKKETVEDINKLLLKREKHLDGIWKSARIFASGFAKGELSIENHTKLLGFLSEEGKSLVPEIRNKEKEINEIDKEIKKLKEELNLANNSKPRERYTAEISVETEEDCKIEIEISYHISGASWKPEYDIRIGENHVYISYLAAIRQSTGEQWDNVSIVLSTITPSRTTKVPKLEPWFIAPSPPKKTSGLDETIDSKLMAASGIGMPNSRMSYSQVIREEFPEVHKAELENAEIVRSDMAISYKIKELATISEDNSYHKVKISELKLERELQYMTIPKLDERVYRIAEVVNGDLFLLPGNGQIFENEEYICPITIDHTSPGEKFKLFTGNDDRIKVNKKMRSREVDKKLLSDKKRIGYSFEIELENFTSETKEVIVNDQIPIPTHEEIKIELENSSPKTFKIDELNRLEWVIKVDPGKKRSIVYEYSIEFPRGMSIPRLP